MSETQKEGFKSTVCQALEKQGIQALPTGNYIVVRIPGLGTTYLKIDNHVTNA